MNQNLLVVPYNEKIKIEPLNRDTRKALHQKGFQSVEKVLITMNGIPKGLCSFGQVKG
jgi:hypothetical protein